MLNELAKKYNTDKSTSWHSYTPIYEELFNKLEPKKLLEIGIFGGASLRMWRDYFPKTKIYGIDNDERNLFDEQGIDCLLADQSNENDLITVGKKFGNFDIIVDDGSHLVEHQIFSFKTLFPFLSFGGIYVIEDCSRIKELMQGLQGYNFAIIPSNPKTETGNDDNYLLVIKK